jgi:hypothetical protein
MACRARSLKPHPVYLPAPKSRCRSRHTRQRACHAPSMGATGLGTMSDILRLRTKPRIILAAELTAPRDGSADPTGVSARRAPVQSIVNYCECRSIGQPCPDMRVFQAAPQTCHGSKRVCRSRQRATKAMPTQTTAAAGGPSPAHPPLRVFLQPTCQT